jgi:hypothetical protein
MNAPHWPLFGFSCLAFLLICCVLAVACWLVFKSGEKGTTKLGAPAGCMVGCALVLLALLGGLGVVVVLCLQVPQELVRHGPFRKFQFDLEPRSAQPLPPDAPAQRRARLVIELRADADWTGLSADISEWLRDRVRDVRVRTETRPSDSGDRTALIFEIDVTEQQLDVLRHDLREVLPTLRLPEHVEAELKDD